MTQMTTIKVAELKERALDIAIDAALGFPRIDVSNFDNLTLEQVYGIAEDCEINFDAKYWTREDFLEAFNNWNATLTHADWVSRLISTEYISVTIGDYNVNKTPVVQNWKARSLQDEIEGNDSYQYGETKDLAALRCFVASKLGLEVKIPSNLLAPSSTLAETRPRPKF